MNWDQISVARNERHAKNLGPPTSDQFQEGSRFLGETFFMIRLAKLAGFQGT